MHITDLLSRPLYFFFQYIKTKRLSSNVPPRSISPPTNAEGESTLSSVSNVGQVDGDESRCEPEVGEVEVVGYDLSAAEGTGKRKMFESKITIISPTQSLLISEVSLFP